MLVAPNGEEALECARAFSDTIDVLVTDVIMPGMTGPELGKRLRAFRPNLLVLYMSGYNNILLNDPEAELATMYLQKPFSFQVLAKKLAEVLQKHMSVAD